MEEFLIVGPSTTGEEVPSTGDDAPKEEPVTDEADEKGIDKTETTEETKREDEAAKAKEDPGPSTSGSLR